MRCCRRDVGVGNFEVREGANGGRIKGRNINPGAILPNMSELAGGEQAVKMRQRRRRSDKNWRQEIRIGDKKGICQTLTPIMPQQLRD